MKEIIDENKVLWKLLADRPVVYHADLAKAMGSVTAGLFLCQSIYWTGRGHDVQGWFYKSAKEWMEELGMSRREQETARRKLCGTGVLEEKLSGLPARLFYRVNLNQLILVMDEYYKKTGKNTGLSSMAESAKQGWRKAPNMDGGKRHPYNTEMTTEMTNTVVVSPPNRKNLDINTQGYIKQIKDITGITLTPEFIENLMSKFSSEKIDVAISDMKSQVENGMGFKVGVEAWLRAYLVKGFRPTVVVKSKRKIKKTKEYQTPEQNAKKREFIRSLYT